MNNKRVNFKKYSQNQSGAVLLMVAGALTFLLPALWVGFNYIDKSGKKPNLLNICNSLLSKYVETRPSGSSDETTPETLALAAEFAAAEDDFSELDFTVIGEGNLSADYTTIADNQPTFVGTLVAPYNDKFANFSDEKESILQEDCYAAQRFEVKKTINYVTKQIWRSYPGLNIYGGFVRSSVDGRGDVFYHFQASDGVEYLNKFDLKVYVVAKDKNGNEYSDSSGYRFKWLIYSSTDAYEHFKESFAELGKIDLNYANYRTTVFSEPLPRGYSPDTRGVGFPGKYLPLVYRTHKYNGRNIFSRASQGGLFTIDCSDYKNDFQKIRYLDYFNGEHIGWPTVSGSANIDNRFSIYGGPVGGKLEIQFWIDDKHGATYEQNGWRNYSRQYIDGNFHNITYWDEDVIGDYILGQLYWNRLDFYGIKGGVLPQRIDGYHGLRFPYIRFGSFRFESYQVVDECKDVPEEIIESTRPIAVITR